ncbi:MAG: iron-containing alcohol dehydrogenase, partial [bacterium]
MKIVERAQSLLTKFRSDKYAFGCGCLEKIQSVPRPNVRSRTLVVANESPWITSHLSRLKEYLKNAGFDLTEVVPGAGPNSPWKDVNTIQDHIERVRPDIIFAMGGGSTIDGLKAANVLACCSPGNHDPEPFFGVDKVAQSLALNGKSLIPVAAIECSASSASHLTRYSNITNMEKKQKKLIIDDAIIPFRAVFDYSITVSMSKELTLIGGLD